MRHVVISWIWALGWSGLIGPGVVACGSVERPMSLGEAVRGYNDGLRWQRFQVAAAHVPPGQRDGFLDERDRLHEDLRISDYEVIRVRYDESGVRARVQVKFLWHLDSRGIVHDTHIVQTWHRQGKAWILIGQKHLRGEPMPGVSPPDEEPRQPEGEPADDPDRGSDTAEFMRSAGN